jgi:hypothetical protein
MQLCTTKCITISSVSSSVSRTYLESVFSRVEALRRQLLAIWCSKLKLLAPWQWYSVMLWVKGDATSQCCGHYHLRGGHKGVCLLAVVVHSSVAVQCDVLRVGYYI